MHVEEQEFPCLPRAASLLSPEKQRFAPLDGLRGVAIAAVFCFHYRIEPQSPAEWGWTGVDLFFAFSGFLITGILFDSLGEQHYFRNFYIRRALRIFPLYWGLWCVLLAFMLATSQFEPALLAWPTYLGNYLGAYALKTGAKPEHFNMLPAMVHIAQEKLRLRVGPYWSLCVEEQYYLTWPLVIWLLRQRNRLLGFCLAAMAIVLAARVALYFWLPAAWLYHDEMYFWTLTRADSLLAGSALALWVRGPGGLNRLSSGPVAAGTVMAMASLALATWRWGVFHGIAFAGWMQTWGLTGVGLAACGVLALTLRAPWLGRALSWKPLQQLGRVSYGFYVFHLLFWDCDRIVIDATRPLIPGWLIHAAVFAWVWLLSWASFRWYESRFLRLKERWGGRGEERKTIGPEAQRPQREEDKSAIAAFCQSQGRAED
jgi:peptidoglycan/LPS O-acetylase OafA/YrhL